MHLVCDNYGTHKTPAIKTWLASAPPVPHALHPDLLLSWLNQVERWFAYLTDDLLRRGDHRSVQALEADIRDWVKAWNENPKPFIWTKTAEQILESTRTTNPTNQRRRTLVLLGKYWLIEHMFRGGVKHAVLTAAGPAVKARSEL